MRFTRVHILLVTCHVFFFLKTFHLGLLLVIENACHDVSFMLLQLYFKHFKKRPLENFHATVTVPSNIFLNTFQDSHIEAPFAAPEIDGRDRSKATAVKVRSWKWFLASSIKTRKWASWCHDLSQMA